MRYCVTFALLVLVLRPGTTLAEKTKAGATGKEGGADTAYLGEITPSSDPELAPMVESDSSFVSLQKTRSVDAYAFAGRIPASYSYLT
uniref:hypothetical protein n=1 Tax=Asaia bogorensis TaxID=91915 RepID=UPI0038D13A3C